ncbi:hypothetical protein [Sphingomonas psychrotolerans]|uniref:cGAS/DncV-like nucleotidyltransferase C-terminal helical domain-containing protein n=1 Tax=Sphingomonas psychrotolerans TaxID=1327635 RepID=A0A2K8M9N7_9SPHN|nr:hypothetical protein [Sphingomonas psychrotolerans]ATY30600.1 hypothetical protein CVN68_00130 [Sphingomonas psychrotolerans]
MTRQIDSRLRTLAQRRKGGDRLNRVSKEQAVLLAQDGLSIESWQRRVGTQPHTRYTLGAMEAVERRYTEISIETALRVGSQLQQKLSIPVTLRLQGSVPLNVHIRGVSDVDLLTLDTRFLRYDPNGLRASTYGHSPLTSTAVLMALRLEEERLLRTTFPAAAVDTSGGKAITIEGGSLARPVDVVPSHWWDTANYQATQAEHDRGVYILDKKVPETISNLPFLHIKRVGDADDAVFGGLRKAIRLTKNVKNDAENEAAARKLPSFDIAALLYHADRNALALGRGHELAILGETQRFLDWCWNNKDAAKRLMTPDGMRTVLNTDAKMEGLRAISVEMDALAREVAREQAPSLRNLDPSWSQVDAALRQARIPLAA